MAGIQRDLGLQSVRVKKDELLEKLKSNCEKHTAEYTIALVGYKDDVRSQLVKLVSELDAGRRIKSSISFDEPQCHKEDYEIVIEMLEMSIDEYIDLSMSEFRQYVQDKWTWKEKFMTTNSKYLSLG